MSWGLRVARKLLATLTMTTVDNAQGYPNSTATVLSSVPFADTWSLTSPETTYASILDITGRGVMLHLSISKPTTTNSVAVEIRVTLDGVQIAVDAAVCAADTAVRNVVLIGAVQLPDSVNPNYGPPVLLPFNKSLKIEARYTATPGGSENIGGKVLAVYS